MAKSRRIAVGIDLTGPQQVWNKGQNDFFFHNGVQVRFCRTPRDYGGHIRPPEEPYKLVHQNPWIAALIIIAIVLAGSFL